MLFSFHYLRSIFGALAMFCVRCQLPLSMTRIQYCFLALCVWILILLTNILMKTFGGLWNWLTWKTLFRPFLINLIMSVLKVVRTSGMSKNHACEYCLENWERCVCVPFHLQLDFPLPETLQLTWDSMYLDPSNSNAVWGSSPSPCMKIWGGSWGILNAWPGNQPTRFYSTCFKLWSLGI